MKLSDCWINDENNWVPIVLDDDYCRLAIIKADEQEYQSKYKNLKDRSITKCSKLSLNNTLWSKRAEYAIAQWAGKIARVTDPGEFHTYPDVGQVNSRFVHDPQDGLMIQKNDQGEMIMILSTTKDNSFEDKTIWLVGWQITDFMRRHFLLINQFRLNKWGLMSGDMEPHEQFIYPRSMLNPMIMLDKNYVNDPYMIKSYWSDH